MTLLTPLPAHGSLRIVFRALGNTYVIEDSGDGTLGGARFERQQHRQLLDRQRQRDAQCSAG